MKRIIDLSVNVNENKEVVILSLNILNDRLIINFKSNALAIFGGVLFKIKMKLN